MDKQEEYERYIKKCELLGTKMFEIKKVGEFIKIIKYIENNESERIVKIPDFVDIVREGLFAGVHQNIKIVAKNLEELSFQGYIGRCIDLHKFDTSELKVMGRMFMACAIIENIDLSSVDTSKVTDMQCMFYGCTQLRVVGLSSFDTSKVKSMEWMFAVCKSIKKLSINNFDTRNVRRMDRMFYKCEKLEALDLSNFDTSSVYSMESMFNGCEKLEKLDISKFNMSSVREYQAMFGECYKLKLIITNRDTKEWLDSNREKIWLTDTCEIKVV